jgi:hypothetical protein
MSNDSETEDYEVGYGKPPKSGQFKRGVSGNLSGRPKKAPDFESQLLRELNSELIINENGKRKRIRKSEGIAKQLVNKAFTGHLPAVRLVVPYYHQALEKAAEQDRLANRSVKEYSTAELTAILRAIQRKQSIRDKQMGLDVIEPLPSTEV